ncbi:MAG: hypothetical protein IPH08_05135 [Rhodocyclaceae bacterium]|nr:hypothetical protein [Rhodocyclaceae bacterium]
MSRLTLPLEVLPVQIGQRIPSLSGTPTDMFPLTLTEAIALKNDLKSPFSKLMAGWIACSTNT